MIKNFAALDENNFVVAVIAGDSLENIQNSFPEGRWVESFIGVEEKIYAGIGYKYDEESDNFIPPLYFTDWDELEQCGCEKSWEHVKIDPNSWI
jgi:hypothetical protein